MALTTVPVELANLDGAVTINESSADVDFRIESNGNANMLFVDGGNDKVLIGHTAARNVGYSDSAVFRIEGTSYPNASIATVLNSNNANGPSVVLGKSRGTSVGSNTVVQDDDNLGVIDFVGSDGTDMAHAGVRLSSAVDGTPGSNDMPGRFVISTTADGSSSPTERMRITSTGNVGIGDTVPAWGSNYRAVTVGSTGSIWASKTGTSGSFISDNSYFNGSNNIARNANAGSEYAQSTGHHVFYTAASVSAGAAQTMNTVLKTDPDGNVTKPLQPAFSARVGATQSNLAVGQNVDIVFGTEVYDVGSNFASSTFNAPVAGKYQLSYFVRLDAIDTAASYYYLMIKTSNRTYYPIYAGSTFGASDPTYMTLTFSVLADMDASDTAKIVYDQTGGTSQVDVSDGVFTGVLVC